MVSTSPDTHFSFLRGGGEMGELTRSYNWFATGLGSPEQWPQSLRTTLSILLNSKFPMFLFWGPELLCFYNDAYRPSLGNNGKHPYALGKPGAEVWPEIWAVIKPLIDQTFAGGEASWSEDQLIPIYRNGQLEDVYWTFSYSPVNDESGLPAGVFVTCAETTKTVQTLRELQLFKQRFQNLIREATIGIIILIGEEMRVEIVNQAYGNLIDRTPDELLGKPLFDIIPEASTFRPMLDKVRLTGEALYLYDYPYFVYVNGEKKEGYVHIVYQPYKEVNGSITGVMVTCQDVTEQVTSRQKIERSEQNLRNIITQAPVAIGIFRGRDLVIEMPNQPFIEIVGKGDSIIGKPLREAMPELVTEGQPFLKILDDVYTSGKMFQTFGTLVKIVQNGVLKDNYYDFSYSPLLDEDGNTYAILDIAVDVTEEIRARQKVTEAEERTRMAVEAAELGTYELNIFTNEIITSSRFTEIFGLDNTNDHGRYVDTLHPDDLPVREKAYQQAYQTGNLDYTARVIKPVTGNVTWIRAIGKMIFDTDKKPVRLLGAVQDITEQVELERQKDSFLGIASHELKTPVTSIKAYTQLMEKMFTRSGDTKNADLVAKMTIQADRLNSLITDLLDVTKINNGKLQFNLAPLDFNALVEDVIEDIQRTAARHVIKKQLHFTGTVVADRERVSQVVINLLNNAIKYSPLANEIIVHTKQQENEVHFYVQDFGIGISQEKKDRVFEQFYRVSGSKEHTFPGLGLGLYISSEIVKRMDGRIWVDSVEGKGSTFCFTLPLQQNQ